MHQQHQQHQQQLELVQVKAGRAVRSVMILYHQTDENTATIILRTKQMKPGKGGLAGGGIYFATDPGLTGHKCHRRGIILECKVVVGKFKTLSRGGDPNMNLAKLRSEGYDSVRIDQSIERIGSGQEYVVYEPSRVTAIKRYHEQRQLV